MTDWTPAETKAIERAIEDLQRVLRIKKSAGKLVLLFGIIERLLQLVCWNTTRRLEL